MEAAGEQDEAVCVCAENCQGRRGGGVHAETVVLRSGVVERVIIIIIIIF